MDSISLEEALHALNTSIVEIETLIFEKDKFSREVLIRHGELDNYRNSLKFRYNFTNEAIGFIEDLQRRYKSNDLQILYNRFSDCLRQLGKYIKSLE